MAKKAKRPAPAVEVTPGANPYAGSSIGKRLGTVLGSIVLILFIVTDELWIGTLACALGFAVIYAMQVFVEKSKSWYGSIYLYAAILSAVLAWAEYTNGFVSNLMKIG